jgi:uncharacterized protein (DUF433 family)
VTSSGPRGIMPHMPDVHLLDRIWVSLILGLLAEGATVAEILDDYPGIEEADVRACIAYGGRLAACRFVDVA